MIENFKDYPKSIAETKAERENDGRLWSPRDLLVAMLRDLDSGKVVPEAIVVSYWTKDPDTDRCIYPSFQVAGTRSRYETVGLLEAVKGLILSR